VGGQGRVNQAFDALEGGRLKTQLTAMCLHCSPLAPSARRCCRFVGGEYQVKFVRRFSLAVVGPRMAVGRMARTS
jgi:hypothetical protein